MRTSTLARFGGVARTPPLPPRGGPTSCCRVRAMPRRQRRSAAARRRRRREESGELRIVHDDRSHFCCRPCRNGCINGAFLLLTQGDRAIFGVALASVAFCAGRALFDLNDVVAERRFDRRADRADRRRERVLVERRHHLALAERAEIAALVLAAGIGRILLRERREALAAPSDPLRPGSPERGSERGCDAPSPSPACRTMRVFLSK